MNPRILCLAIGLCAVFNQGLTWGQELPPETMEWLSGAAWFDSIGDLELFNNSTTETASVTISGSGTGTVSATPGPPNHDGSASIDVDGPVETFGFHIFRQNGVKSKSDSFSQTYDIPPGDSIFLSGFSSFYADGLLYEAGSGSSYAESNGSTTITNNSTNAIVTVTGSGGGFFDLSLEGSDQITKTGRAYIDIQAPPFINFQVEQTVDGTTSGSLPSPPAPVNVLAGQAMTLSAVVRVGVDLTWTE